jgi:uncharacterized protein
MFTALAASYAASIVGLQRPNLRESFQSYEFNIPMRDGKKLYTVVWVPKNLEGKAPILMERTPYGAGSPATGPRRTSPQTVAANYIFAYQDVRGKNKSEGDYVNVRPLRKAGETFDETTDTYDTVDFLIKNVPKNNGNVGMWGISYPGFYAGIGAINNHPALKAVSPQAPVSDWFLGDDVHHNGALFLQETFDFMVGFDVPRGGERPVIDRQGKSAYQFFLDAGPISTFDSTMLKGKIPYWNDELMKHDTYDQYWKDRSLPRNFSNVKCAVLTVGGFFDKEDMWGALNLYKQGEKKNKVPNFLVMGPWLHGGWTGAGKSLNEVSFDSATGDYYKENIEFPFFEKYLNNKNIPDVPEASIFETGTNTWHKFTTWPPKGLKEKSLYFSSGKGISFAPESSTGKDSYVNDPAAPTPYLWDFETSKRAPGDWLIRDQAMFEKRADVLTYKSEVLKEDLQIVGGVTADLFFETTGTDADMVVKVIDEFPSDSNIPLAMTAGKTMAGYQMMVRSDIFRAKFRNSFEKPEALKANTVTRLKFDLNDTMHTFKKGHRVVFQVQSSWFPIADQNPNKFMNIHTATAADFQKATIGLHRGGKNASRIVFRQLAKK